MDSNLEKSFDRQRSLLLGLFQKCLFFVNENESCPLSKLRNTLSFEEKYNLAMRLSEKEVNNFLEQHEQCFKKRFVASVEDKQLS